MKMKPLHDNILVQRIQEENKTKGGIYIPDSAKEKPSEGKVIEVGPGRSDDKGHVKPLQVEKGDRILFGKYGGTEVKIGGEEYLIMSENDVLVIIEDESKAKKK